MPEISLRAYMREIDELIESEKLDEAIAHCRHILHTYPKHLETYRLLGKSYLEAKRYGDAADIFQRVLSAVPDDFVAHIGMAIVREDEGNLDAAIWHMERAFETNPANPAIQQELRRLIGRRDGLEPHKVRLTRGALARMYAHGELYQQAIAELRSALQEDPERPDLQVLLADMYWRTEQRDESLAVSNRVLEKLPHCLAANRIVAASLQSKERVDEAAVYHRRLAGLDPYAAFVETALVDSQSVDSSAVTLERFEWQPGEPLPSVEAGRPGWAATLGMELQEREAREAAETAEELPKTGPLPSWLEPGEPPPFVARAEDEVPEVAAGDEIGLGPDEMAAGYAIPEMDVPIAPGEPEEAEDFRPGAEMAEEFAPKPEAEPSAAEIPEAEIPEWMRDAGWGESTGEAAERPISFSDEELSTLDAGDLPIEPPPPDEGEGELAPAELPDWIHDIAPAEELDLVEEIGEEREVAPGEVPGWLDEAAPAAEGEPPAIPEPAAVEGIEAEPEMAQPEEPESEPEGAEIDSKRWPTWISDETPGATDTIVTWLTDREGPREEKAAPAEEGIPAWMGDTGPLKDEEQVEVAATEPEEAAGEPSWIEQLPVEEPPIAEEIVQPEAEGIPSWIEEAEEPEEELLETAGPEEPSAEEVPGWLAAVAEAAAKEGPPSPEPELDTAGPTFGPMAEEPAEAEEIQPAGPPDWISQLAPEEHPIAADEFDIDIVEAAAELTGEIEPEEIEVPSPEEEQPLEEPASAEAPTPEAEFPAASEAPEWLQGLAETVKQSEPAAEPDWLPPESEAPVAEEPTMAAAETPDWLKGLAEEGPPEQPAAPTTEAPDWLKQIVEPADQPPIEAVEESRVAEAVPDESAVMEQPGAPDWMTGVPEEETIEPSEPVPADLEAQEQAPVIEPPDWVKAATPDEAEEEEFIAAEYAPAEPALEAEEPEIPIVAPADEGDEDEVLTWLEDLAAKQADERPEEPADETWGRIAVGELPSEPLVEDRQLPEEPEEGLEWLEQLAEQRGIDADVGMPAEPAAAEPAPEEPGPGPPSEAEVAPPEEPREPEEVPDWLKRMATAPTIPIAREAIDEAIGAPEIGEPAITPEPEAAAPVDEVAAPPPEVAIPPEEPAAPEEPPAEPEPVAEEPEEEVPEWLQAMAAEAPPTAIEEEPVEPAAEPVMAQEIPPSAPKVEEAPAEPVTEEEPAIETAPVPEAQVEPQPAEAEEQPEAEPVVAEAPPPTKPKAFDPDATLKLSRQAIADGDSSRASELYGELIKRKQALDSVIEDLKIALDRSPEDPALWQSLGDAYMKADRTSEAIDAYRKGMEAT